MTKKLKTNDAYPQLASEVKVFLACPSEKAKISKRYVLLRPTLKAFFYFLEWNLNLKCFIIITSNCPKEYVEH